MAKRRKPADEAHRRDQPHDSLFKATFSEPKNALDLIRHALPAAVLEAIDPRSLRHEAGSYIDSELAQSHSDVLLSANVRGRPALLYVLIEHQSSPAVDMPLRLLRYVLRVWERWLRRHPKATRLPAVIPLVVHQGPGTWDTPRTLAELIDLPADLLAELARFMPGLDMIVDDLGALSPAAVAARAGRPQARVTLTLLRGLHDPAVQVPQLLALLADGLRSLAAEGGEGLRTALLYIVRQRSGLDPRALVESVRGLAGPAVGEVAMSTYQELIDQGVRSVVERQLRTKFGKLSSEVLDRLAAATPADLESWSERLLTADRLEDVFAARSRRGGRASGPTRKRKR